MESLRQLEIKEYKSAMEISNKLFDNRLAIITPGNNASIKMLIKTGTEFAILDSRKETVTEVKSSSNSVYEDMKKIFMFKVKDITGRKDSSYTVYRCAYMKPAKERDETVIVISYILYSAETDSYFTFFTQSKVTTISVNTLSTRSEIFASKIRIARLCSQQLYSPLNDMAIEKAELAITAVEKDYSEIFEQKRYIKKANKMEMMLPEVVDVKASPTVVPADLSIQDKYIYILEKISKTTSVINASSKLSEQDNIKEYFDEIKQKLESLVGAATEEVTPEKDSPGWFSGWFTPKKKEDDKTIDLQGKSIDEAIDIFFGKAYEKYEDICKASDSLKKCNAELEEHKIALTEVAIEAQEYIQVNYNGDILKTPLVYSQLVSTIRVNLEKLNQRIDSSKLSAESTTLAALALGTKLPEMKAELSNDSSQNILLNQTNNYQSMINALGDLAKNVSEATNNNARNTVLSILDGQEKSNSEILPAMLKREADNNDFTEKVAAKINTIKTQTTEIGSSLDNKVLLTNKKNNPGILKHNPNDEDILETSIFEVRESVYDYTLDITESELINEENNL